ncbi:hypothetical protein SAMN04489724_2056 [Algoriphagus locisalis]|uniref:Uncharacterized protein n=1 Tax=Algoriphagus locisalis TaxID=305507 RepID=A0A1I7ALH8_9BACT|nr:molecular chaperone DnaK [Algoriphagus locisalis]SFT75798.1 hypothetical protein SAMN04489724_2056 [Algoriphagus locisalis]
MKISKEDFESMKLKYSKEVKKGKPAKNKKGKDKTDQTNWIFFNRETLEGLLAKADKDPKKGGIQFYITEYTEEVAAKYHPKEVEELTGALTLVMRAANLDEDQITLTGEEDEFQNDGMCCPPFCEPEPDIS